MIHGQKVSDYSCSKKEKLTIMLSKQQDSERLEILTTEGSQSYLQKERLWSGLKKNITINAVIDWPYGQDQGHNVKIAVKDRVRSQVKFAKWDHWLGLWLKNGIGERES